MPGVMMMGIKNNDVLRYVRGYVNAWLQKVQLSYHSVSSGLFTLSKHTWMTLTPIFMQLCTNQHVLLDQMTMCNKRGLALSGNSQIFIT